MLDEEAYNRIWHLYGGCMQGIKGKGTADGRTLSIDELFEPLRAEYRRITGMADCHHNAIMHHRISIYGPPCSACGKPLRTPRASFCAACGQPVRQGEG